MHFTTVFTAAALATLATASPAQRRAKKAECSYNSKRENVQIDRTKATFDYYYYHDNTDGTDLCTYYEDGDNQENWEFTLLDCKTKDNGSFDHVTFEIPTLGQTDDLVRAEAIRINQDALNFFQENTECVFDPEFET